MKIKCLDESLSPSQRVIVINLPRPVTGFSNNNFPVLFLLSHTRLSVHTEPSPACLTGLGSVSSPAQVVDLSSHRFEAVHVKFQF